MILKPSHPQPISQTEPHRFIHPSAHPRAHMHTHAHACAHTRTHAHTHKMQLSLSPSPPPPTHTHTHSLARTHAHKHTRTHTHGARTLAGAAIYTHIPVFYWENLKVALRVDFRSKIVSKRVLGFLQIW